MICNCKESCIKTKKETLHNIENRYKPCPKCSAKTLKKAIPLKRQIKLQNIDKNYQKCENCGKRHIDIVMAHVLKNMIEEGHVPKSTSIRNVGTPLITPATSLEALPYLNQKSLVIITTTSDEKTAQKIMDEVPEIKAIIKGDINQTVGILDEKTKIVNYELLAGCDIRCDIQYTDVEPILIYKNQSMLHIEYPKKESPKIRQLRETLEKYENPTVLDAMCGPGTLGIYAIQKNAEKVLFNDINNTAIEALKTNLEINEIPSERYEIRQENILDLANTLPEKYDIGIVDAFPQIDTSTYVEALEKICTEVIII